MYPTTFSEGLDLSNHRLLLTIRLLVEACVALTCKAV